MSTVIAVWCTGILFFKRCETVNVYRVCLTTSSVVHKVRTYSTQCTELEVKGKDTFTGRKRVYVK